jgi:arylmalonate decarboxylase
MGWEGPDVMATIARLAGAPTFSASDAALTALRALGARRLTLVTPYIELVNQQERSFLEGEGFEVVAMAGMDLGHTQAERRSMSHQPPARTYRLARETDVPEAEAVYLSCTNLPTLEILDLLERDLGKPVVSSNQAMLWYGLRQCGLPDRLTGAGRLFRED